jgi:P27 family predicted phage terminase small subunit
MTRGRKPIPPQLKLITGNPGKRRIPEGPDLSSGMPKAPKWLTGYGLDEWKRIGTKLHSLGLLNVYNSQLFASLCQAVKIHRIAVEQQNILMLKTSDLAGIVDVTGTGTRVQNVLVGTINSTAKIIERLSVDFGLPPIRNGIPKEKQNEAAQKSKDKNRFFK